jgi:uncharacterized protein YkwD
MHSYARRSIGALAAVLALPGLGLALGSAAPSATAGPECPNADAHPGEVSDAALGRATLCLVNEEREERGLVRLRPDGSLARAADRHADDMVRRSYFAHTSRSGSTFFRRIARTGYLRGARRWWVGENLAWGSGSRATPRSILRSWMTSPKHRDNILYGRFRELGVGVARGAPTRRSYEGAATYVHEFGVVQ